MRHDMAHEKTIAAYAAIGEDWIKQHERGDEKVMRLRKEMVAKDPNKKVKIFNVTRVLTEDGTEAITWHQDTVGHTDIGNSIRYHESPEDICMWFEPIPDKEIRYNQDTQQQEIINKQITETIPHYLYPFNKQNIEMISKLVRTSTNRNCQFAVRDALRNSGRAVKNFEEWSTKPFDSLIVRQPVYRNRQSEEDDSGEPPPKPPVPSPDPLSNHQHRQR